MHACMLATHPFRFSYWMITTPAQVYVATFSYQEVLIIHLIIIQYFPLMYNFTELII